MNIESLKEEDVLNTRGANEAKAELTEVTDTISVLLAESDTAELSTKQGHGQLR